ncbi:AcrR family transcriptional regulator [Rhodoferax ferrireducens]|uniref:AcrR family transcriptional regulator n=1 Tax=Rhodoferax ferrireducens TaxID=192843 RepID=A0ABU2CFY8_9BURK|nr:TetR/AcrR family transcriptional regulator [Rhodoferax ferrireducens]MDR7380242.1 AcrR family transcriptional regulator [Rhodoferax ferrireducens]
MKVRTDAKRDAILRTAGEVFLEMGYERTSMAEIAARVGGSKATLYGYFPSKEALFMTLAHQFGADHIDPAMDELMAAVDEDLTTVLERFCERLLVFLSAAETISAHRLVLAEAGHSDVGRLFYEAGQKQGMEIMGGYLQSLMDRGHLRQADPVIAAQHLGSLVHSEVDHRYFYRDLPELSPEQIKGMVARAVQVFLGGYSPR